MIITPFGILLSIFLFIHCDVQTSFSQFAAIGFGSRYQDFFVSVIFLHEISGVGSCSDKFLFRSFNSPVMKLLYIITGCFGRVICQKTENSTIFLYCLKKVCCTRKKFTSQSNSSVNIQEEQFFSFIIDARLFCILIFLSSFLAILLFYCHCTVHRHFAFDHWHYYKNFLTSPTILFLANKC